MSHVFISYNQEEADFAFAMSLQLEKAGFDTWLDKNRLRPGNDWSQAIDRGIVEAFALIVIMSPSAKASEYVTYEWSFALGTGIPVFPILRRATDLHPRLGRLQYMNFTRDQPWSKLVEELKDVQDDSKRVIHIPRDTPPYIRHSIAALDSANAGDREGAIASLAEIEHPVANAALATALSHPLRDVRFAAALVLGKRGDDRAIPNLLNSQPAHIYEEFHELELADLRDALVAIGNPLINPALEFLKLPRLSENTELVSLIIEVFGHIGSRDALPWLSTFIEEVDLNHLEIVMEAIQGIDANSANRAVVSVWNSVSSKYPEDSVRIVDLLIDVSVKINNKNLISMFKESLRGEYPQTRVAAAIALSKLSRSKETIAALTPLLKDHAEVSNLPYSRKFSFLPTAMRARGERPLKISIIVGALLEEIRYSRPERL